MLEKELKPNKVLVVTHDGKLDERINVFIERFRGTQKEDIIYVSAYNMPERPPIGTSEVFVNCRPSNYFVDREGHYDGLSLTRLVWSRDGGLAGLQREPSFREEIV